MLAKYCSYFTIRGNIIILNGRAHGGKYTFNITYNKKTMSRARWKVTLGAAIAAGQSGKTRLRWP
jgi:hypothetical protein